MTSSSMFWKFFVSLVKFSYWSKFHVNIITSSGVMTIFFYKGLTKNPEAEIGNTPVSILPNIWTLGQVRNANFGTYVCNKMFLYVAKCQGYSFYRFRVIKGKPTGGVKFLLPQPRLGLVKIFLVLVFNSAFLNYY